MAKNIVICTDGTWNAPDQKDRGRMVPSNVVRIARAVSDRSVDGSRAQIYYYDPGVGTGGPIDRFLGGVFGTGLVKNTKQAYSFLCRHYEPDDQIFIFGFSRGAYTARYLAGLIGRIGIRKDLKDVSPAVRIEKVEAAFDASRRWRAEAKEMPDRVRSELAEFRAEYCHLNTDVHFLGVWDTVGSLGIPLKPSVLPGRWRYSFVDVRLSSHVKNAYHALAIDEARKNFKPTLWVAEDGLAPDQTVEQVWFPGVHSNIGGGYADTGLSDRALLWMVLKAEAHGLGIDGQFMYRRTMPNYHGELRNSRKGIWKWLGYLQRDVCGASGVNQHYHFSAEARHRHTTNNYRPDNLLKVLDRSPKPVADTLRGEKEPLHFADYQEVGTADGYWPEEWRN